MNAYEQALVQVLERLGHERADTAFKMRFYKW